jgi:hypothetical protein
VVSKHPLKNRPHLLQNADKTAEAPLQSPNRLSNKPTRLRNKRLTVSPKRAVNSVIQNLLKTNKLLSQKRHRLKQQHQRRLARLANRHHAMQNLQRQISLRVEDNRVILKKRQRLKQQRHKQSLLQSLHLQTIVLNQPLGVQRLHLPARQKVAHNKIMLRPSLLQLKQKHL